MKLKLPFVLNFTLGFALAAVPVAVQQAWADQYDTKKTVTLTGTVTRMWFAPNTPFWIVLETKKAEKGKQRWVIVGNTMAALRSAGWVFAPPPAGTLHIDEEVTLTAYLPKSGSKAAGELAAASPPIAEELKTAHLAHGIEMTLPSGRKMPFGASQ